MSKLVRATIFLFGVAALVTCLVYWPGLSGDWLFDDYSSIVENPDIQITGLSFNSLHKVAVAQGASDIGRPLTYLSFAFNYYLTGLNPFWMKLTNLVIHLFNGALVFLLSRLLFRFFALQKGEINDAQGEQHRTIVAAAIACGWMVAPINLTGVLYVVQRMESLANLFVLLGLLAYAAARTRMLESDASRERNFWFVVLALSLIGNTVVGILGKETAVMLPLYAFLLEWLVFSNRSPSNTTNQKNRFAPQIAALFCLILLLPFIAGMIWLLPKTLNTDNWAGRDFTLHTRLLSEARIVVDYLIWTLVPPVSGLKFYYDDFPISQGLLSPWTTLASLLVLGILTASIFPLRKRQPLVALGVAFFLSANLLTSTILPLELVFEHRNYFASYGLILALGAALSASYRRQRITHQWLRPGASTVAGIAFVYWSSQTLSNAYVWGSPLRLAETLAARSPQSPRAQYALGRLYSAYTQYNPSSPFRPLAERQLESAGKIPKASILPEQALIYMTARMHEQSRPEWWEQLIDKLRKNPLKMEDQIGLQTLAMCAVKKSCELSTDGMSAAYQAALEHKNAGALIHAAYGDYAWLVLQNLPLAEAMLAKAVHEESGRVDYQIALISVLAALGKQNEARAALLTLQEKHPGEIPDQTIAELAAQLSKLNHRQ